MSSNLSDLIRPKTVSPKRHHLNIVLSSNPLEIHDVQTYPAFPSRLAKWIIAIVGECRDNGNLDLAFFVQQPSELILRATTNTLSHGLENL
ncbi:hypothetical protein TNIN_53301 [Trichonephila inaurata madagascariensis]|uniref:Uncharacterized protein n=1 Tax=Trichonephila inaurata madagascariensis TaxID=2747483 RepID=A0A8X6YSG0_9ARAC|nr:hypothetical protein TNIN_53301 [Trichonephila inaurata madagascariensis]